MEFDFDPAKSDRTLRERGFDFDYASLAFEGDPVVFQDLRRDCGEARMIAIGEIDGALFKGGLHRPRRRTAHHLGTPRQPAGEADMANRSVRRDSVPRRGRADFAVIDATTEDDIRRHLIEDGFDPDNPFDGLVEVLSPAEIRRRAGLTQPEMARHLRIPVATWRNWEQGRTALDPAIRSFLNAVSHDPEYIFRLIAGRDLPDGCKGQLNRMLAQTDVEFLISLVSTPGSFDDMPIPNEATRLRRIEGETRFDAVFAAVRQRRAG